jgi:hypothetical protein
MHRRRAHGDGECSFVLLFCVNLVFCFLRIVDVVRVCGRGGGAIIGYVCRMSQTS